VYCDAVQSQNPNISDFDTQPFHPSSSSASAGTPIVWCTANLIWMHFMAGYLAPKFHSPCL